MIDLSKVKIVQRADGMLCIHTRHDKRGDLFGGTLYLGVFSVSGLDAAIERQIEWTKKLTDAGADFQRIGDELIAKHGDLNEMSAAEEKLLEAAWKIVEGIQDLKQHKNFLCDSAGPVDLTPDGLHAMGSDGTVYELRKTDYWKRQRSM